MATRPKRSVSRPNYSELADVRVPRTRSAKVNKAVDSSTIYRLNILERDEENGRVKVRYIGYGRKYDEWRKTDDIIDLNEEDCNSDEETLPLLGLSFACLRN